MWPDQEFLSSGVLGECLSHRRVEDVGEGQLVGVVAGESRGELVGDPPAIICQVGGTQLRYDRRAIDDLHAMLKAHGDWMPLGGADEQKPAPDGSVEAWGRSETNPVGGWYGMKKGLRGRFGVYLPPLLEALGLAEVTHDAKNNRMRAI